MPNILLTRPKDQSEAFAKEIETCGWTSTIWPLLTIRSFEIDPIAPNDGQSLIFTSANAIKSLPDPASIRTPAICVGPATATEARNRGFTMVTDVSGNADKLVQVLLDANPQQYLHVRGVDARGDIAARLTKAGRPTEEVVVYEAIETETAPAEVDTAIMAGKIDAVALFSPRSAAILRKLARVEWAPRLSSVTVFAISPSAAEPARDMGFTRILVAKQPNRSALRAAICSAANE